MAELSQSHLVSKMALGKLSADLVYDPELRDKFIADSRAFMQERYGDEPNDSEQVVLDQLAALMDKGLCCGGCGCLLPEDEARIANPSLNHYIGQDLPRLR